MQTKGKKILKYSLITVASIGAAFGLYKLIKYAMSSSGDTNGGGDDFEEPKNSSTGSVPNNTSNGDPDGLISAGLKSCGIIRTDFDGDFNYVKCSGVWYTKSKPTGGRPTVYTKWVSLGGNALATQRLNSRYPNG